MPRVTRSLLPSALLLGALAGPARPAIEAQVPTTRLLPIPIQPDPARAPQDLELTVTPERLELLPDESGRIGVLVSGANLSFNPAAPPTRFLAAFEWGCLASVPEVTFARWDGGACVVTGIRPGAGTVTVVLTDGQRRWGAVASVEVRAVVPELAGLTRARALSVLEAAGLSPGNVMTSESPGASDLVLSHRPPSGTRLQSGAPVDLVLSIPATVAVPPLTGLDRSGALALLERAGLVAGTAATEESRAPVGTVTGQSPVAGTRVLPGTAVGLVLAEPVTVLVPSLVERTESEAREALAALELGAGLVSHLESPTPPGVVIAQGTAPGTRVAIGTTVPLVLAAVETVSVPPLVGGTVEEARRALLEARLAPGVEELVPTVEWPEGNILEQGTPAGTVVAVGTAVDLRVATPALAPVPPLVGRPDSTATNALTGVGLQLGNVTARFSFQPGGTVLAQSQSTGTFLEPGTPIDIEVAMNRLLWAGPLGLLFFGILGTVGLRRRRPNGAVRPPRPPRTAPSPPVRFRPATDPGRQYLTFADRDRVGFDLRVTPVPDAGSQEVEPGAEPMVRSTSRMGGPDA